LLEVNVENLTDTVQIVTTQDFKIKNITTNEFLTEKDTKSIFPPNDTTGYYIDFARLRPKISEQIPGEKLHFTCEFSIATPKDNSMYSVASTCSYGYTIDKIKMEEELAKQIALWKSEDVEKDDIAFESKNWKLLEGQRVVLKDSFDFIIQSIGVFSNKELIKKASSILVEKLKFMQNLIDTEELKIIPSENTMKNSFDIILENEDYTIGKTIEFMLYSKFFENAKTLTYCGFKKMHPHDTDSIIRISYKETVDKAIIKLNLTTCITDSITVFESISNKF
jgi:DNA-directed RNA polymerase subunit L